MIKKIIIALSCCGFIIGNPPPVIKAPASSSQPKKPIRKMAPPEALKSANLYFDCRSYQDAPSNHTHTTSLSAQQTQTVKQEVPAQKPEDRAIHTANTFLTEHTWHILGAGIVISYAAFCYLIIRGNAYLGKKELWSSWHQELPLDQLLAMPQQQLAQELLQEIQRRNSQPGSLKDLVTPLALFIQQIEQEEEQLQWYQAVYGWLQYLYLAKLVPFSQQRFAHIPQRLQRTTYYKNIFHSWASQYQLDHAARCAFDMLEEPETRGISIADLLHAQIRQTIDTFWIRNQPPQLTD